MPTIKELGDKAPQWLRNAKVSDENVEIVNGIVNWRGGIWKDGTWKDGIWENGTWKGGIWKGGIWKGGIWENGTWERGYWNGGIWENGTWERGTWESGTWESGIWYSGTWGGGARCGGAWRGGAWKGGTWHDGVWCDKSIDRLTYMAGLLGIMFDSNGIATAYRVTHINNHGFWNRAFIQHEGEHYYDAEPAGSGTCVKGIHVSGPSQAWNYYGQHHSFQLWEVKFKREDFLDCDGQKARIRGGVFKKIPTPWLTEKSNAD